LISHVRRASLCSQFFSLGLLPAPASVEITSRSAGSARHGGVRSTVTSVRSMAYAQSLGTRCSAWSSSTHRRMSGGSASAARFTLSNRWNRTPRHSVVLVSTSWITCSCVPAAHNPDERSISASTSFHMSRAVCVPNEPAWSLAEPIRKLVKMAVTAGGPGATAARSAAEASSAMSGEIA